MAKPIEMPDKQCRTCGKQKPLTDFYKRKSSKDGVRSECKQCFLIASSNRYQNNREKHAEYYQKNRDAISEKRKAYYLANKESLSEYFAAYRKDNRERIAEYRAQYNAANSEKRQIQRKRWADANPERKREHEQRRRTKKLENGTFVVSEKFLRKLYSSPCLTCGTTIGITADHVIPISRGGVHSEGNLMPLCQSCNSSKKQFFLMEWRIKINRQ